MFKKILHNEKSLILAICLFAIVSSLYLAHKEASQADINTKNVWMIYFTNPKDSSLNFSIENHSQNTRFHWTLSSSNATLEQNDIIVQNGQTKTITVSPTTSSEKMTVSVSTDNMKKEIYKNF